MNCRAERANKLGMAEEPEDMFQRVWNRTMPEDMAETRMPVAAEGMEEKRGEREALSFSEEIHPLPDAAGSREIERENGVLVYRSGESDQDDQLLETVGPCTLYQDAINEQDGEYRACENDFPSNRMVICLGSQCMGFEDLLQEMIQKEIQDSLFYKVLSRKVGGTAARIFSGLSSEERQQAKRLSAAYFLISGIRYWPEKNEKIGIPSYFTALRDRFIEEQRDAAFYIAAATESRDPCLSQLFLDIAEKNQRHAQQIRHLLEQM